MEIKMKKLYLNRDRGHVYNEKERIINEKEVCDQLIDYTPIRRGSFVRLAKIKNLNAFLKGSCDK